MSKSYAMRLILRLLVVVAMQQQQLLIYKRQIKRLKLRKGDRLIWVLCRKFFPRIWQKVLAIVRPDTVIRWHRDLARLRWRWISKHRAVRKNRIPQETRGLVRHMAEENPRWGAERIRGELLKLGIRLGKRTIQKLIRPVRKRPRPSGKQSWKTFIANHSPDIWASDFFTVWTLGFKQIYVFVVFAIHTREILHWNVTEYPDSEWTYRQILCATWDRKAPRFLICDRDNKYSGRLRRMVKERLGIRVLRTPYRAPKANAFAERLGEFDRCIYNRCRRIPMKIQAEIPDQLYKLLQTLVSDGWYLSEQDVIEEALRRFLHTHKPELMEKFILEDLEWGLHGKI